MPTLSDSDSDGEMPTLDQLFQQKRKGKTVVNQQHPSPSPFSLDRNEIPSGTIKAQDAIGVKVNKGASQLPSPPPPLPTPFPAVAPPPSSNSTSSNPRVPLRPLPSSIQPSSPQSTPRRRRPRPKGATSAELIAQDERTNFHSSPAGVIREEVLIVEYRTDSEVESSSCQEETSTEEESSSSSEEDPTSGEPSSSSSASSSSSTSPPLRMRRPAGLPTSKPSPSKPAPTPAHSTNATPRVLPGPTCFSTPTQYPQPRYRPKGYATHQGYQSDPFFDPSAYIELEKRDAVDGPLSVQPTPTDEGAESSRRTVGQERRELSLVNEKGLDPIRRMVEERRLQREKEDKEIIPATESEHSSSSDDDEEETRRHPSNPCLNPFQTSSFKPAIIDLVSTPRVKPRRAARPTELFGSYTSTPLASSSNATSFNISPTPAPPASPFIDLTDSPANTPQRRRKGKGPRPTELFQFITRERKKGVEVEVEAVALTAIVDGSRGEYEAVVVKEAKEISSVEKKKKQKRRKDVCVERRKSGKGCWVGEAVEEVRAVEGEGGEEEESIGEGVLMMLDEELLADVGSPLPTCVASSPTLPIDPPHSPSLPSRGSATLTSFKRGRRVILDSDDEVDSPSLALDSPLPTANPNTKGKSRQTIIHELSDSDSSSLNSTSPQPSRNNEEDYWGEAGSPSTGVLSFSPPPPPAFLPPTSPSPSSPLLPFSPGPTYSPAPPAPRRKPTPNTLPAPRRPPPTTLKKLNSKAWKAHRSDLALQLISELDKGVFESKVKKWLRLEEDGEERKDEPRGVVWTGKLRTTAGMSRWSRKKCSGGGDEEGYQHFCRIELSAKVLDTDEKILSTTAHELCHLATWIFDGKDAAPHGKEFKSWAKKVNRFRPDIVVTTRHDYEITHKFTWKCSGCDASYGRDSRSIDPSRQCCGKCQGRLVPQHPDASTTPSKPNAYRDFVKERFKSVQASSPGASHGEVMRVLGERWRIEKLKRETASGAGLEGLVGGLKGLIIEVDESARRNHFPSSDQPSFVW